MQYITQHILDGAAVREAAQSRRSKGVEPDHRNAHGAEDSERLRRKGADRRGGDGAASRRGQAQLRGLRGEGGRRG